MSSAPEAVETGGAGLRARDLVLLGLLALGVRLVNLDSGLWFDEIWLLVRFLRQPFVDLVTTFESDNVHPLYAVLSWTTTRAFGESPWAVRLPAMLLGVGSVLATYVVGTRFLGRREGVLGAFLLAISTHHVSFSQNARGYTGLAFFTLVACYGFSEALRTGRTRYVVLQAVGLAFATWVHMTGVFVAFAQLAALGLRVLSPGSGARAPILRAPLVGVFGAGALSLALHGPILGQMLEFFTAEKDDFGSTDSEWRTPLWMVREIARSLGLGEPVGLAVLGVGAVVFAAGWLETWRRHRELALFAVLPGLLGQGSMWLLGRNLWPRFFFSLAGFLVLVGVVGVTVVARRVARVESATRLATVGLIVVGVVAAFAGRRVWLHPKQDFPAVHAWVESERGDDVRVHTVGLAMFPLAEYVETDWVVTESPDALDEASDGEVWVVVSGWTFTRAYYPQVAARLAETEELKRFPSQTPDLDLVVVRLAP